MSLLARCRKCRSLLAPWESYAGGCACKGRKSQTNADTLYAVACTADTALPAHDYLRLAQQDFGAFMSKPTAEATMAPDPRFCWAGPGMYGLYRHGVLPGPRRLEECARLTLMAAGPLHMDVVGFILKQLGYRFADGSLRNAIGKSNYISWDRHGWSHPTGEAARLQLRREIAVVPPRQRAEFDEITDRLTRAAAKHLITREQRLASIPTTISRLLPVDWDDG
jgi:hypothetical protein